MVSLHSRNYAGGRFDYGQWHDSWDAQKASGVRNETPLLVAVLHNLRAVLTQRVAARRNEAPLASLQSGS